MLTEAKDDNLYLVRIAPQVSPFNSLRGNTKDIEKMELAERRPGSPCPRKYLISNTEFTEKPICPASRQYQNLKLKEFDSSNLNEEEYKKKYNKLVEKSCICVGLETSALLQTR